MLLVYTHKITPRLTYIFKHYFVRTLQIPITFSTKIEEFVAHNGLKMTYGKMPLGNEFFVQSHSLLFEQGVNEVDIQVEKWDDIPCFFKTNERSNIPFDIFAAGFYLISRYEEYLPHLDNEQDCFSHKNSLAYKHDFLEKPVVDIWAYKLQSLLKDFFPTYDYETRQFRFISTINVPRAYIYKHQGLARSVGRSVADLCSFQLRQILQRTLTVLGFRKDPYDTFQRLLYLQKHFSIETIFFFSIGNYSLYDRNSSFRNVHFRSLIKSISDYAKVGLLASYFTINDEVLIKKEKERLEGIINIPVKRSRQYYSRLNIPETYQHLIDLEVEEDYSMVYKSTVGFRASTCTPFYFYDLDFEIQTPLKIFPTTFSSTALKKGMNLTNAGCKAKVKALMNEVKKVNGTFISLFHNHTLSELPEWKGWRMIYEEMLKNAKDDTPIL